MDESDDIPRGSLGEVTGVDGEERSVKFAEKAIFVSATKLNVSDFQKDSFVALSTPPEVQMISEK